MSDLLICEIRKFKRKKIFYFSLLMALIFPILGSVLMLKGNTVDFSSITSFIREESGFLLLLPLLAILAINSFFLEEDNDTIKNLLAIPIKKKDLILAKLSILLIFSIIFQLVGFLISLIISLVYGIQIVDLILNFTLSMAMGVFLWAAALPSIVIAVWLNKNYLLSIIIVFAYTLVNYIMHFSEAVLMQAIGFNIGSLMPVPLIFRWLYQFQTPIGQVQIDFYNKFSQYFISTSLCFYILLTEAVVCIGLMIKIYKNREI